jgi:hypothetical protein
VIAFFKVSSDAETVTKRVFVIIVSRRGVACKSLTLLKEAIACSYRELASLDRIDMVLVIIETESLEESRGVERAKASYVGYILSQ